QKFRDWLNAMLAGTTPEARLPAGSFRLDRFRLLAPGEAFHLTSPGRPLTGAKPGKHACCPRFTTGPNRPPARAGGPGRPGEGGGVTGSDISGCVPGERTGRGNSTGRFPRHDGCNASEVYLRTWRTLLPRAGATGQGFGWGRRIARPPGSGYSHFPSR